MSIPLQAVQPVQEYFGVVNRFPIKVPQGVIPPVGSVPPSACPLFLDWNIYWTAANFATSAAVHVNLQAQSVQAFILDRIASVKIDNTGSPCPIYVWFKDTNDVVTCPPNTVITTPVMTNNLEAVIIAQGLVAGGIPQTRIFFSNVIFPPIVDPELNQSIAKWRASPLITRGTTIYNTLYDTPALGDQTIQATLSVVPLPPQTVNIFPVQPNGFYYMTNIVINQVAPGYSGNTYQDLLFESTGPSGILYTLKYFVIQNQPQFTVLLSLQGAQIKINATEQWRLRNNVQGAGGFFQAVINYTYQPAN